MPQIYSPCDIPKYVTGLPKNCLSRSFSKGHCLIAQSWPLVPMLSFLPRLLPPKTFSFRSRTTIASKRSIATWKRSGERSDGYRKLSASPETRPEVQECHWKSSCYSLRTKGEGLIRKTCLATSGYRNSVEKPIKKLNKLPRDFIVSASLHDEGEFIFLSSAYLVRWQESSPNRCGGEDSWSTDHSISKFYSPVSFLSIIRNIK